MTLIRIDAAGERGRGVYAERRFEPGEKIIEFTGPLVDADELDDLDYYLQVGPREFMGPSGGPDDLVNHSCEPSCGLREVGGRHHLVAIRPIGPGDELTFDYSTTMVGRLWSMEDCRCGEPSCRGRIGDFEDLDPTRRSRYIAMGVVPAFVRDTAENAW